MSTQEISNAVMELPEKERLQLARRIIASIVAEREVSEEIEKAVAGIEDVVTGKVRGLSESEFRDALR
ncbi:MAG: addiction module antitoxin RelB [Verrucomicrobia bacterium]|nr:MAG: addiction module antitoxin RelB [Verrucomicrobiota bacterium]